MELKPALTFEEQLDRLRTTHKLAIEDEQTAIRILSHVNYYRLSAYGIGLHKKENPEEYEEGVSLMGLYGLYRFDSGLRGELFHLIEQVEVELRTQIAYHLSLAFGPDGYMNPENFKKEIDRDGNSRHTILLKKFEKEAQRQGKLPFVRHHQEQYGGRFPIWVAVELFSFGMLTSLYSLMKAKDQKAVADFYAVEPQILGSWMKTLMDVRNRCAHYGRIYNMPLSTTPSLFSEHDRYRGNRIFPVILVLRRLTAGTPGWTTFFNNLCALIDETPEVRLLFIGFPDEWYDVLNKPLMPGLDSRP